MDAYASSGVALLLLLWLLLSQPPQQHLSFPSPCSISVHTKLRIFQGHGDLFDDKVQDTHVLVSQPNPQALQQRSKPESQLREKSLL